MEAHKHTQTDSDIRVTREVGIHLQRVQEKSREILKARKEHRIVKDPVYEVHRQIVTQYNLLYQTIHNPEDGNAELSATQEILAIQLGNEVAGLHNRTCHQLGEETYVETKVQDIPDRFYQSLIHIRRIAYNLKGVERDSHRQDNLIHPEVRCCSQFVQPFCCHISHLDMRSQHLIQNIGNEVTVLEVEQNPQVYAHAQCQPRPFLPLSLTFIY